jgi:hypothetical protein
MAHLETSRRTRRVVTAILLVACAAASPRAASAQSREESRAREERDSFVGQRTALMWTLAGWALTSVAVGAAMTTSDDRGVRHAGVQNVAWGGIDGAIAGYALFAGRHDRDREETEATWRAERAGLQRVFVINAALDVVYVAVGAALVLFAKDEGLRGTGAGVLTQGGFLLAFDSAGALVAAPSQRR